MRLTTPLLRLCLAAAPAAATAAAEAQSLVVAGWGSYEVVTERDDWSVAGGQLTLIGRRGDRAWVGGDQLGRFGEQDLVLRAGGALHPATAVWLSLEGTHSTDPAFSPENAAEADVTIVLRSHAATGLGYRYQRYEAGDVHIVMPHATVSLGGVGWEMRMFVARNPAEQTDLAFLLRANFPLGARASGWLGGGAGEESYVVDTPPTQTIESLQTITAIAGARYVVSPGTTLRLDVTFIRSEPVLSRRGLAISIEQRL
jgi:YaiO family outer membrane protein